jgi:hypothetical protein
LHVDFHDAEATDEVCILSIDADAANTLVTNDGLGVEIADVGDVTLGVYQVNVRVGIDYYEALSLLTPADMADVYIAHTIDLIVGIDALVFLIVLVESS